MEYKYKSFTRFEQSQKFQIRENEMLSNPTVEDEIRHIRGKNKKFQT